jgi:hypothetical protein
MCVSPLCVRIHLGSHWTDFHEIWYSSIFRRCVEKIQFSLKSDKHTGYCTWRQMYIFYNMPLISSWNEKVSNKSCRENRNTHFCTLTFFPPENGAVYKIMWRNIVQRGRPQMIVWRMRPACWIPNAKNTHSQYVTLIALPLQKWLYERSSVLRYACIACLVFISLTLFTF